MRHFSNKKKIPADSVEVGNMVLVGKDYFVIEEIVDKGSRGVKFMYLDLNDKTNILTFAKEDIVNVIFVKSSLSKTKK